MSASPVATFYQWIGAGLVLLLCWGVQAWTVSQSHDPTPLEPLVRSHQHTVPQTDRCAACHAEVCQSAAGSPHQRTLAPASDARLRELFAGRTFQSTAEGPVIAFAERDQQLWMQSSRYPTPLKVDWMFGSGRHAITPASLLVNAEGQTELIASGVSWFAAGELGPTPGADQTGLPGIRSLGDLHDHRTTLECFGCHVTQLPVESGTILGDRLALGVTCDRCHPGADRHADSMDRGGPLMLDRWSDLTPLEAVNRCGECHRRADQLTPQELQPDRPVLVRFASVGLAMSPCFLEQDQVTRPDASTRLDCRTCHDPHRPADRSPAPYLHQCAKCHGPDSSQARVCSSPDTATNCLPCHMPPVLASEKLVLTDHWIRIRKATDPPVAQRQTTAEPAQP